MTINPLLQHWTTPFELPPFAAITPSHFMPAFEEALAQHNAEIHAIAESADGPTFGNVIDALEKSGDALSKVSGVFYNLASADTNEALQQVERAISPRMAAHYSAIYMRSDLFARVAALYEARETLALNDEQMRVLERYYKAFVRSGAKLGAQDKLRMAEIAQRLATLGTQFSQNVLKDESSWEMVLDEAELDGLPAPVRAAAAQAGRDRGHNGKFVITLLRSSIEPYLQYASRRDLRERAFKAWTMRGQNGGASDNIAIVQEMLQLRAERAQLLGYKSFAHFKLDDTMAKTPEAVRELLETVWRKGAAQANRERADLESHAHAAGEALVIEPWDWRYYAEKVRQQRHNLDEAEIKSYLPLDGIISAAFDTASKLFGLRFQERTDLPTYHADVRTWEVTDQKGALVGIFYGDYFARPSKRSGAWMSAFRTQEKLGGAIRPVIVNVMNFAKAAPGAQALLSYDDARTLFHEFGHGLHGLLSDVTYPMLAGTAVSRDFVELPSQLYEHWFSQDAVLSRFARNRDGEAMPKALIEKILGARTFNQGFATVEYCASALVDLEFHLLENAHNVDPVAFEKDVLDRIGMPQGMVMRHRTPHFTHVFSGDGYSAGYYSYLWSEVLDADAFDAFEETGDIFNPAVADRLKKFIYAAGNRQDAAASYTAFRGQLPSLAPLLRKRGFAA